MSIIVKAQMDSFLNGFKEVVSLKDIRSFNEAELELLISGVGTINIKDWRDNTEYKDCSEGDKVMNTLSFAFKLCKTTFRSSSGFGEPFSHLVMKEDQSCCYL